MSLADLNLFYVLYIETFFLFCLRKRDQPWLQMLLCVLKCIVPHKSSLSQKL
nr:MAG TPA: hypothetical protein [Caudoviricetes sp.]DAP06740.1 MAG TPA: hypothetical protein [Caudoviricetes sp.]